MQTLDLAGAAKVLFASEDTVRELAAAGKLPAAKIGRSWVFVDIDLIEYVRSQYAKPDGTSECHSTNEETRGGSTSLTTDKELDDLLGLTTNKKQKPSTINLRLISDNEKNPAKQ